MINKKCTRCGKCCLTAPCFAIPLNKEKHTIINGVKIHICPHLTFDIENLAHCTIYSEVKNPNGTCTSSYQNYYEYFKTINQEDIKSKVNTKNQR